MPKTNRRRTTHRKRTSQRKRKRGGGRRPPVYGWGPFKTPSKYGRYNPPKQSDEIPLRVHLTLIDELGYYFTQSNLQNSVTNDYFGTGMVVIPDGNYAPDDIVLPDITLTFSQNNPLFFLRTNIYPSDIEIKTYLQTNGILNVDQLRIIVPETYRFWGWANNPIVAIRGNCLHGDEDVWLQNNNRANPLYKYNRSEAHPIYT